MPDISTEILDLNNRIDKAKELLIRLQSKREDLIKRKDDLIAEIKEAGYNPDTLKEDRERLQKDLIAKKSDLEDQLKSAEKILNSIME
jgi:chromosome segregation ATPase